MENFTWLLTGLAAVIGAIIGGAITGGIAYRIFQKQLLCTQYSILAEDLQAAVTSHSMWKSTKSDDEQKSKLKKETELYLNRAWARALVTLPDDVFLRIDDLISRGKMNSETRNRLYYMLRQELYPNTSIEFDKIQTRNIEVKE